MKDKLYEFYLKCKSRIKPLSSDEYIYLLRKLGVKIGKGGKIFNTRNVCIEADPVLLEIGDYVKVTQGVVIITHDYSRSVLRRVYGQIIGDGAPVHIGNNVFIGINSIILMGTEIGDNTIVGAGSVVKGKFPPNVVIAGSPARIICSLKEFHEKRKKQTVLEAKEYIRQFFKRNARLPQAHEMRAFFPLFLERSIQAIQENNINLYLSGDEYEEILESYLNGKSIYDNLEQLCLEAFGDKSTFE